MMSGAMLRTLTLLSLVALLQSGPPEPAEFKVICHPGVKGNKVPRETLAEIFLKRTVKWGDGAAIEPVDRSMTSPLRVSFSRKVLGRSPAEVQIYWSKAMRDGIRPPVVKGSDEDVIAFVSGTPGAIGYVASGHELPATVKAVDLQ
jgi:ABC-type phosphate transport system substrate-binding protein